MCVFIDSSEELSGLFYIHLCKLSWLLVWNNDFVSTIVFPLLGSLLVIWISQYLVRYKIPSNMFTYLGRNSIIVVCTHVQIMQMIQTKLPNMNWLGVFLLIMILYYCGLIFICRKYLPFIFGMRHEREVFFKNIQN